MFLITLVFNFLALFLIFMSQFSFFFFILLLLLLILHLLLFFLLASVMEANYIKHCIVFQRKMLKVVETGVRIKPLCVTLKISI